MVCSQPEGTQKKDWLSNMPELGIIANIEPVFIFRKSSSDITPEVWLKLAEEIHQRLDKADGFVVFHGLDNILYTSSALSFLLQDLTKPIVFTGGKFGQQVNKRLEIRANLINASQGTSFNLTEVGLMFGNRLLRANQAVRAPDESLNIFITPPEGVLGRIDFSIRLFDKLVVKGRGKAKLFDRLSEKVEIINISPLLNLKALAKRLPEKEGIVINADAYQNFPQDLMFLLEKITAGLPVIIWSRRITDPAIVPKNVLLINNLTWETTVTKFMWVLTQSQKIAKVKELMIKDLVGEIIESAS